MTSDGADKNKIINLEAYFTPEEAEAFRESIAKINSALGEPILSDNPTQAQLEEVLSRVKEAIRPTQEAIEKAFAGIEFPDHLKGTSLDIGKIEEGTSPEFEPWTEGLTETVFDHDFNDPYHDPDQKISKHGVSAFHDSTNQRPMMIVTETDFSVICLVGELPFHGKVQVAYEPDEYLLEFISFETFVHNLSDQQFLVESLASFIYQELVELLEPLSLTVVINAESLQHGPTVVTISSEDFA